MCDCTKLPFTKSCLEKCMSSSLQANLKEASDKEVIKMALSSISDGLSRATELIVQGLINKEEFQQIKTINKNTFKLTLFSIEGLGLSKAEAIANSAFEVLDTALYNTFRNS